jgi:hypothetical protein
MVFLDRVRLLIRDGLDRVVLNDWVLLGLQIPHFVRNDIGGVGMTIGTEEKPKYR